MEAATWEVLINMAWAKHSMYRYFVFVMSGHARASGWNSGDAAFPSLCLRRHRATPSQRAPKRMDKKICSLVAEFAEGLVVVPLWN